MRVLVCPFGSARYLFLSGIMHAGAICCEQDVVRATRIRKTCMVYFKSSLPLQICKFVQIYFNTHFAKHTRERRHQLATFTRMSFSASC